MGVELSGSKIPESSLQLNKILMLLREKQELLQQQVLRLEARISRQEQAVVEIGTFVKNLKQQVLDIASKNLLPKQSSSLHCEHEEDWVSK